MNAPAGLAVNPPNTRIVMPISGSLADIHAVVGVILMLSILGVLFVGSLIKRPTFVTAIPAVGAVVTALAVQAEVLFKDGWLREYNMAPAHLVALITALLMWGYFGMALIFGEQTRADKRVLIGRLIGAAYYLVWVVWLLLLPTNAKGVWLQLTMTAAWIPLFLLIGLLLKADEQRRRTQALKGGAQENPAASVSPRPSPVQPNEPSPAAPKSPLPTRRRAQARADALAQAEREGFRHTGADPAYAGLDIDILAYIAALAHGRETAVSLERVSARLSQPVHIVYARVHALELDHRLSVIDSGQGTWSALDLVLRPEGKLLLELAGRVPRHGL